MILELSMCDEVNMDFRDLRGAMFLFTPFVFEVTNDLFIIFNWR